jgi:UTP-glucose-1-phosphate uridylyltransferase
MRPRRSTCDERDSQSGLPCYWAGPPVPAGRQGDAEGNLSVVDRPLIQHMVDEARGADIEHFVFVIGDNKGVIEVHFDRQGELEHTLTERRRLH